MRTHPLIALAVVAAAITTVTVFGQSVPVPPLPPARKPHHADASLDAQAAKPAASTAVPAWLVASAPGSASAAGRTIALADDATDAAGAISHFGTAADAAGCASSAASA